MNELIMNFQEELLNEEIAWHNIETSYLVERTTDILNEAVSSDDDNKEPGKIAAVGKNIVDVAEKIYNAIVNALKSIGNFFSDMFDKLSAKITAWKSKASSAPTKCEAMQVEMPDVSKLANASASESTAPETVPVVTVKVDNPKSFIATCLGQISKLFDAVKALFSKAKSEGEKGKSEAKKAKSGDSKALAAAGEKKQKVSLYGRVMAFIFRGISKILMAISKVYQKKSDKAYERYEAGKEKSEAKSDKYMEKEFAFRRKAKQYKRKAAKYEESANPLEDLENNPFLLESILVNEEVEDLAIIDEELEELENFLEDYED